MQQIISCALVGSVHIHCGAISTRHASHAQQELLLPLISESCCRRSAGRLQAAWASTPLPQPAPTLALPMSGVCPPPSLPSTGVGAVSASALSTVA